MLTLYPPLTVGMLVGGFTHLSAANGLYSWGVERLYASFRFVDGGFPLLGTRGTPLLLAHLTDLALGRAGYSS